MICDGREIPIDEFQDLYDLIGTTYGAGDSAFWAQVFYPPPLKHPRLTGQNYHWWRCNGINGAVSDWSKTKAISGFEKEQHELIWKNFPRLHDVPYTCNAMMEALNLPVMLALVHLLITIQSTSLYNRRRLAETKVTT